MTSKGIPCRSASHSRVGPARSATRAVTVGLERPLFFAMMSAVSSAGLSSIPLSRWKRVPAAGMKPEESAVEPRGTRSRSSISTSAPASRAASEAVRPHAPAPITSTGTQTGK